MSNFPPAYDFCPNKNTYILLQSMMPRVHNHVSCLMLVCTLINENFKSANEATNETFKQGTRAIKKHKLAI